ncbi:MAG: transposase [Syntrophomonadaceae bacterium]|nr:transposase [Syntrophomonadaceae bacterium]
MGAIEDGTSIEDRRKKAHGHGFFILICSEMVEPAEILPLYYTRQAVEQIFDVSKNEVDLLPLRVHGEETLRGHLMLVFISSLVYLYLNDKLKATKYNAGNALLSFRNLKCKVYGDEIIVKEPLKAMHDIAKVLKITIPKRIVEGKECGN